MTTDVLIIVTIRMMMIVVVVVVVVLAMIGMVVMSINLVKENGVEVTSRELVFGASRCQLLRCGDGQSQ